MNRQKIRIDFKILLITFLLTAFFTYIGFLFSRSTSKPNYEANKQQEIEKSILGLNESSPSVSTKVLDETPKKQTNVTQQSGRSIRVPILTYHYIGNNPNPGKDPARDNLSVAPDLFDAQMGYLATQGYTPITLDTLYAGLKGTVSLPTKPVVITFDDGYIDLYVNAYPILRKYNFHAVAFIPTGLMGQGYYLSWDQIKEMDSSGLISFQAHSVHHANLAIISSKMVRSELTLSKKDLEARLGKPVNFIAYPYGTSNQTVLNLVRETGYAGGVGTWFGTTISEGTIYDMPRVKIPGGLKLSDFPGKL